MAKIKIEQGNFHFSRVQGNCFLKVDLYASFLHTLVIAAF